MDFDKKIREVQCEKSEENPDLHKCKIQFEDGTTKEVMVEPSQTDDFVKLTFKK